MVGSKNSSNASGSQDARGSHLVSDGLIAVVQTRSIIQLMMKMENARTPASATPSPAFTDSTGTGMLSALTSNSWARPMHWFRPRRVFLRIQADILVRQSGRARRGPSLGERRAGRRLVAARAGPGARPWPASPRPKTLCRLLLPLPSALPCSSMLSPLSSPGRP